MAEAPNFILNLREVVSFCFYFQMQGIILIVLNPRKPYFLLFLEIRNKNLPQVQYSSLKEWRCGSSVKGLVGIAARSCYWVKTEVSYEASSSPLIIIVSHWLPNILGLQLEVSGFVYLFIFFFSGSISSQWNFWDRKTDGGYLSTTLYRAG